MNIGKYVNQYSIDLRMKYESKSTINNYKSQVIKFLNNFSYYERPKDIPNNKIKLYLLTFKTYNTRKSMRCAINSFYKLTCGMPKKISRIPLPKKPKTLPKIIDKDFLLDRILNIENLKHKAILSLGYSVGLRISEVINLKITDIDSKRMVITVNNAKGNKDRIVKLSENLLKILRNYFKIYRPTEYLFNGQFSNQYSTTSINKVVKKYLGKNEHYHKLRHSSFTSMLENGTDITTIQKIAGHSSINTTQIYTHISINTIKQAATPI